MWVITWCPKCNQVKLFPSAALQKKIKVLPTLFIEKTLRLVAIYMVLTLTATECVNSYNHVQMCVTQQKKQVQTASPLTNKQRKQRFEGIPFVCYI